jgi:RNA polymerase sigma factor (sigma-70 family)
VSQTDTGSETEEELFAAVGRGEEEAWRRLLDRYGRLVYGTVHRLGLSGADADEVFQATFITLHRHAAHIRKPASLASWIVTTCTREAWRLQRDARRRSARDLEAPQREETEDSIAPEQILERMEAAQLVRDGVRELGGNCAALLQLLYLAPDEPSYREVAERLDVPIGSIGPTRMRCLARLARQLEGRGVL